VIAVATRAKIKTAPTTMSANSHPGMPEVTGATVVGALCTGAVAGPESAGSWTIRAKEAVGATMRPNDEMKMPVSTMAAE
jgi:type IV secretory pathway TrbL component